MIMPFLTPLQNGDRPGFTQVYAWLPNESVRALLARVQSRDVVAVIISANPGTKGNLAGSVAARTLRLERASDIRRWKLALQRSVHRGDWGPPTTPTTQGDAIRFLLRGGSKISYRLYAPDGIREHWGEEVLRLSSKALNLRGR